MGYVQVIKKFNLFLIAFLLLSCLLFSCSSGGEALSLEQVVSTDYVSVISPGQIQFDKTLANPFLMQGVTGVGGRRLSLEAMSSTGSMEVQLVPGAFATGLTSQILFYNIAGDNYERLGISTVNNQYIFDSTYNGAGTPRNIYFQMGGSDSNNVPGQNAISIYNDASIDLNGSTYTKYSKIWGATRTRIVDPSNTGASALILDTRTGTPADNITDTSYLLFRRGGVNKWFVGLNSFGSNTDSFDIYSSSGAVNVLKINTNGTLTLTPILFSALVAASNGTVAYC